MRGAPEPQELTLKLSPEDVEELRFRTEFRGYRMVEVDDALDLLKAQLMERDVENAVLRRQLQEAHESSTLVVEAPAPQVDAVQPEGLADGVAPPLFLECASAFDWSPAPLESATSARA